MDPAAIILCIGMSLIGCGLGTFSGLVPGIHVNTLSTLMLASYPSIEAFMPAGPGVAAVAVACCIMSASVVHSFVDFVPSVFIGVPDSEDAVSVLPGHRLVLAGRGMEAVRAAAIGSIIGCSAAILISIPLQWVLMNGVSDQLDRLTIPVLLVACTAILWMEYTKGNILWGIVVFVIAGFLGLGCMILPIPVAGVLGEGSLMMPLLTGLFGIPVMLASSEGARIPTQKDRVRDPVGLIPGLKGVLMGAVAGWFPGITSTVGASMSAAVFREGRPEGFISTVASIGSVTAVLSLVTLSVSGNGRSGTSLVIGEMLGDSLQGFMSEPFTALLFSAAMASIIGYEVTIVCGRVLSGAMSRMRPRKVNRMMIVLLVVLTVVLTGPFGLLILVGSVMVGFLPGMFGTGRMVLTGCLILPVLIFRFGIVRAWTRPWT